MFFNELSIVLHRPPCTEIVLIGLLFGYELITKLLKIKFVNQLKFFSVCKLFYQMGYVKVTLPRVM